MAETLDARVAFLQRQLHAVSLSVQQARARGDTEAVERLRETYRSIARQVQDLQAEAYAKDAPSDFMQALDRFSDETIAVGKEIGAATVDVIGGVASLAKYLPLIAVAVVVVVALVYAGKLRKGLGK